jgi:hypothetical protein
MKNWHLLTLACVSVTLCSCASASIGGIGPVAASAIPASVVIADGDSETPPPPHHQAMGTRFSFNGVDEEYAMHDPSLPTGAQPRTLTAWFRTTAGDGAHVIANWGTPRLGQRFGLLVDAGRVKLVGESQDIMTSATFADGRWHHAAATFDGSYAVVYIDGKPEVSARLQLDTRGDRFVVGNAPIAHGPERWLGEIDGVAVYRRALGGDEVAKLARL